MTVTLIMIMTITMAITSTMIRTRWRVQNCDVLFYYNIYTNLQFFVAAISGPKYLAKSKSSHIFEQIPSPLFSMLSDVISGTNCKSLLLRQYLVDSSGASELSGASLCPWCWCCTISTTLTFCPTKAR